MMTVRSVIPAAAGLICSLAFAGCDAGGGGKTYGEIASELGVSFTNGITWGHDTGGGEDVPGQVGYSLTVNSPRFDCPGPWYSSGPYIVSGELPPGLEMDEHGEISGVPTQRGHWIVGLKISNIRCNGVNYTNSGMPDVVFDKLFPGQDRSACIVYSGHDCELRTLRFHITGSGAVVQ
jgi:hypothetical protein